MAICSWCRGTYAEDKIESHEQWHSSRGDTKGTNPFPELPPATVDDYTDNTDGIVSRNDTDTTQGEAETLDIPE